MLQLTDYERIRFAHFQEGKSQRQICRELGHSRKTVRKAIENAAPTPYKRSVEVRPVLTTLFQSKIDEMIEADKQVPRKQRHTAMRLFERLCDEYGYTGSYATVNRYAAPLLAKREVFMELAFDPAEELQIDWGQAEVVLDGKPTTVHVFCARCCSSKASFARAYLHEDQVSFLDGHDHAIRFFGFLHRRYCYDNLSAAVISRPGRKSKPDKQAKRVLTVAFRKLRSHYRMFNVRFCTRAKGNEKGHVENLVKYTQRTLLCPQPSCPDLETLNELLLDRCTDALRKETDGTVRQALLHSYAQMMPDPLPEPYRPSKSLSTIASKFSCVRYDNCQYSVPTDFAHQPCVVTRYASTVTVSCRGKQIAEHERAGADEAYKLNFEHYLKHLERKKGWLVNGRAFRPENLPTPLRRFRCELLQKFGDDGLRRLVEVLMLYQDHPSHAVDDALNTCLGSGAIHEGAVLQALRGPSDCERQEQPLTIAKDSVLAVNERTGRDPADYDVVFTWRAS